MDYLRRHDERGHVNLGWLNSYHSFSFGHYYDPAHMGFSVLRVINDDTVRPGAGFGTHGHRDMEIISYVRRGALQHADSMGETHILPAGDIQVMSAGTGVTHSEFNASQSEEVAFLQIWILPARQGLTPRYQQSTPVQDGPLTLLVSPDGEDGSLQIHQDVRLHRLQLAPAEQFQLALCAGRAGYLHLVEGSARTAEAEIVAGDALGLARPGQLALEAGPESLEALWFDLPGLPA